MARSYKPVKKLSDTFTTSEGKTMTRRQLSNLISRANYRVQQSRKHLTSKEYNRFRTYYEAGVQATGAYPEGQGSLTLKGITDPRKLRAIEKQARRALQSHFISKKKYQETNEKRYAEYIKQDIVKNREEFNFLQDLMSSDAYKQAIENNLFSYSQMIQSLQDEVFIEGCIVNDDTREALQEVIERYSYAKKARENDLTVDENGNDIIYYDPEAPNMDLTIPGFSKPGINDDHVRWIPILDDLDDEQIAKNIINELIEVLNGVR